ncbi:MAG: hypothetical protein HFF45_01935 [Lawsonibacter sp.]|nr:hypothetical protein [Lawsonibacter sp.]
MSEIMKRWWKSPRNIVVGKKVYHWSLVDRPQYRELRVYREKEKQPALCLRLTWPECWAIDLFRPKAVAYVIGWYEGSGRETLDVPSLQAESALLKGLLNLFFSPEEQVERERFLERVRNLGVVSKRDL